MYNRILFYVHSLFLLYINDVVQDTQSCVGLFADDTSLYIIVDNPNNAVAMLLNSDLETIHEWANGPPPGRAVLTEILQ